MRTVETPKDLFAGIIWRGIRLFIFVGAPTAAMMTLFWCWMRPDLTGHHLAVLVATPMVFLALLVRLAGMLAATVNDRPRLHEQRRPLRSSRADAPDMNEEISGFKAVVVGALVLVGAGLLFLGFSMGLAAPVFLVLAVPGAFLDGLFVAAVTLSIAVTLMAIGIVVFVMSMAPVREQVLELAGPESRVWGPIHTFFSHSDRKAA